jgi:hypothetical protein
MFMYNAFEFDSMIVTPLSPFQTLLKETEAAENAHVNAIVGNHPEGIVDAEVARIASENTADPDGLEATKIVAGASIGDTKQESQKCDLGCAHCRVV